MKLSDVEMRTIYMFLKVLIIIANNITVCTRYCPLCFLSPFLLMSASNVISKIVRFLEHFATCVTDTRRSSALGRLNTGLILLGGVTLIKSHPSDFFTFRVSS